MNARWVLAIVLVAAPGCSLLVDTRDLSSGVDSGVRSAEDAGVLVASGGPYGGSGAEAAPRCATVGPRAPTSVVGWSQSSGARARGDGLVAMGDETDGSLVATGFGFVVPRSARVVGVTASILRRADLAGITDREAVLVGGPQASASRADTVRGWPTAMGIASYGGTNDTWGAPLDPALVESATFGLSLSVSGSAPMAEVDEITLTVTYCE